MTDYKDLDKPTVSDDYSSDVLETIKGNIKRVSLRDPSGMANLPNGFKKFEELPNKNIKISTYSGTDNAFKEIFNSGKSFEDAKNKFLYSEFTMPELEPRNKFDFAPWVKEGINKGSIATTRSSDNKNDIMKITVKLPGWVRITMVSPGGESSFLIGPNIKDYKDDKGNKLGNENYIYNNEVRDVMTLYGTALYKTFSNKGIDKNYKFKVLAGSTKTPGAPSDSLEDREVYKKLNCKTRSGGMVKGGYIGSYYFKTENYFNKDSFYNLDTNVNYAPSCRIGFSNGSRNDNNFENFTVRAEVSERNSNQYGKLYDYAEILDINYETSSFSNKYPILCFLPTGSGEALFKYTEEESKFIPYSNIQDTPFGISVNPFHSLGKPLSYGMIQKGTGLNYLYEEAEKYKIDSYYIGFGAGGPLPFFDEPEFQKYIKYVYNSNYLKRTYCVGGKEGYSMYGGLGGGLLEFVVYLDAGELFIYIPKPFKTIREDFIPVNYGAGGKAQWFRYNPFFHGGLPGGRGIVVIEPLIYRNV